MSSPTEFNDPARRSRVVAAVTHPRVTVAAVGLALFGALGANQLWTQEGRWAVICREMSESLDYFHPEQLGHDYFDKPLLSYWFILLFAKVLGGLDELALRLPSALAGALTVGCVARLCHRFGGRPAACLAAWVAISTVMFTFWARVSSADMLNVAVVLVAVTWYYEHREAPGVLSYAVFFGVLGIGSHLKGPVAAVFAVLAIAPDVLSGSRWRRHLRPSLPVGVLVGALAYVGVLGLGGWDNARDQIEMVIRENFTRYVDAFDHKDPIWTYCAYLPFFLLPWVFLAPAIGLRLRRHWAEVAPEARFSALAMFTLFVFLTLSSSRRSYYVLPLVPLFVPLVVEWSLSAGLDSRRFRRVASVAFWIPIALVVWNAAVIPAVSYDTGLRRFGRDVEAAATAIAPWDRWSVVVFGSPPRAAFYVHPPGPRPSVRFESSDADLLREYLAEHPRTIVLIRRKYLDRAGGSLLPGELQIDELSRIPDWLGDRASHLDRLNIGIIPRPTP